MIKKQIYFSFLVLLLMACSQKAGNQKKIEIDGSSTVYPITEAIAEEFNHKYPDAKVTIGISGTGGGFNKLIRDEISIADASRPVSPKETQELKAAGVEFIELPIAYDGLVVTVNPKNSFVDYLTVDELKKIWVPEAQGKITKWSQVRAGWPDKEIHLYGPGTASGTFDYFTEAIVGKAKASRGDYTASEDDNVLVQGVSMDVAALGFFGLEYYLQNKEKLKLVPIDDNNTSNGEGAITPSRETVKNGTYQPLSRPLFLYINKGNLGNKSLGDFINFYLDNAPILVPDVGYIPLTDATYSLVKKRFKAQKTGSAFAGKSIVGIKMEDLLK